MNDIEQKKYYHYLTGKTKKAIWYHRYCVYPRIKKRLGEKILDVGCGIGWFLDSVEKGIGLDTNIYALQHCRKKGHRVCSIKNASYPFRDQSFDAVVMDNVLEHLENAEEVLREIYRVLKNDGTLIVGVPGEKGFLKDKDHRIYYDESALENIMVRVGFQMDEMFYAPFKWNWLDRKASLYCLYGVFRRIC